MNPDSKYKLPYRSFVSRPEGLSAKGAPYFRTPKLNTAQRTEISYRRYEGEKVMDLALEYGVSTRTIYACATPLPRP